MNIELSNRQPIIRRFKDIAGIATSHGAGIKKCLATMADKIGPATQIALTTFGPDESVESHLHPSMDEHFIILSGSLRMTLGNETFDLGPDTYLLIPAGMSHSMKALEPSEFITIGIVNRDA